MGDRQETKNRILNAVGDILSNEGFPGIGVNKVARKAGVDKVLIYRYFGDMPGLLREFASRGDYWPSMGDVLARADQSKFSADAADLSVALLTGYIRELRNSPAACELLLGELLERNELAEASATSRQQQGMELIQALQGASPEARKVDLPAIGALLSAGLTFLMLRSRNSEAYLGIDIATEEGWERIERGMETLIRNLFDAQTDTQLQ